MFDAPYDKRRRCYVSASGRRFHVSKHPSANVAHVAACHDTDPPDPHYLRELHGRFVGVVTGAKYWYRSGAERAELIVTAAQIERAAMTPPPTQ